MTLDDITLPDDLLWLDRYKWSGVAQQEDVMADGSLVIQADTQQTGRPITLQGGDNFGWLSKAAIDAVRAKAVQAGLQMSLTLPGETTPRNVVFTGDRLIAEPVVDYATPDDGDYYTCTLYLMEL